MDEKTTTLVIPRWVAIILVLAGGGVLLLILASLLLPAHSQPMVIAVSPTPTVFQDERWDVQRVGEVGVQNLLAHDNTLWVGGETEGLIAWNDDGEPLHVLDNANIAALTGWTRDRILVGYVAFRTLPTTQIKEDSGDAVVELEKPAFMPGAAVESGIGQWDGKEWTPLWTEMAVWGVAPGDEGLYLSTNNGVYLLKGKDAYHLGLDDTLCFGLLYDEGNLWVGTLGGIWRYHAGDWQQVLDLPEHKAIALVRDQDDGGRFYAATAAGLYVSADGETWTRRGDETLLVTILLLPDGRILAGGDAGIYEVQDETLHLLVGRPTNALTWYDGAIYAGSGDGLWRVERKGKE